MSSSNIYPSEHQYNKSSEFPLPEQGADEAALVGWLDSCFALGLVHRRPYERAALLSMLFWAGQQWISIVKDNVHTFSRRDITPDNCEVRRINNQLPIYTRQIVATMCDNLPELEAIPASMMPNDVEAAKLATRALQWRDREDKEPEKREQEIMWMMGTGEVLRRTYWDAKAGRKGAKEGDVSTEVVNFFRYVKDPHSTEQWPPRWLIEYDARDIDWVRSQYGISVESENVADQMRFMDKLAMNVMQEKEATRQPQKHAVVLKRMYVQPSERYPDGHCWVWAGGKLLKHHDLQAGQFPFSVAKWYPIPGRLYPISLIELLMSDQRQLNLLLSQIQEASNRQLRQDIITQGTAQKAKSETIDPRTGQRQVMIPAGTEKWDFLRYDLNFSNTEQLYSRIIQDMHEKAGQNQPSLGQPLSKNVTVGELQLAREGDMQSLQWHQQQYARHLVPIAQQKLVLMQKYYKNYRFINLFGDKQETEYFRGSDLRDTRDVIAFPQPHLTPAMKRQARVQAIEFVLQNGAQLNDPTAQFLVRTWLKKNGLQDLEDELAQVFGPFEDLQKLVTMEYQKQLVARQMQEAMAMQQLQQQGQMLAQAQAAGQAGGQPGQPGVPGGAPQVDAAQLAQLQAAQGGGPQGLGTGG